MASRSKLPKSRIEDRISRLPEEESRIEDRISKLPEEVLCHILSFLTTLEAVKTSVLSRRWKKVWASVPTLDLNEQEFYRHRLVSQEPYNIRHFEEFVNRILFNRGEANIHSFYLCVPHRLPNVSHLDSWISTAIRHNVVELDLKVGNSTPPIYEIPIGVFTCNTLMSLKLWLCKNVSAMTPSTNCFSSLKFLHVFVTFPDRDSMEKLFSCCPALEQLVIHGLLDNAAAYNINISGPKLKRLQISFIVEKYDLRSGANNFVNYGCQIFVSVDAPNLEEVDITYDFLVSYSLKNAKCLREANIGFLNVKDLQDRNCYLGLPDRICQLFADICNAKYLTVAAPIIAALDIRHQSCLPTFSNLNKLELQLQTCHCVLSVTALLKISPNLEHLKTSSNKERVRETMYCYCDGDEFVHKGDAPEIVPGCLFSHLKTICLWDFKGCQIEMKVAKYLLKHGKALNELTIYTRSDERAKLWPRMDSILLKVSEFPRGSKSCEIDFQTFTC